MHPTTLLILLSALLLCAPALATPPPTPTQTQATNAMWSPENVAILSIFLIEQRAITDKTIARTAVFDFDNTCIFNDIGELVFRQQLSSLTLKLSPDQLDALLPTEISGISTLKSGTTLAAAKKELLKQYSILWPAITDKTPPDAAAHDAFKALMAWYYDQLLETDGIGSRFGYAWSAKLLSGLTKQDVKNLVAAAHAAHISAPIQKVTWSSKNVELGLDIHSTFIQGLRPHTEIQTLMHDLIAAGVSVYIVSASPEAVIEEIAPLLGFPVDAEHAFGIRVEMDGDQFTTRTVDPATYPVTYREGKAEVIQKHLPGLPVLVAGDSMTDYEMLVGFPQTKITLLINRNRKDQPLRDLYKAAIDKKIDGQRAVVLQGRDENLGTFIPSTDTISLGDSKPKPVEF